MGKGLSTRQKRLLALLVVAKEPLDLTDEVRTILGDEDTRSARVSLIAAARSLEQRGLVMIERVPQPGGGHGRLLISAREGARGELTGADLQRARR